MENEIGAYEMNEYGHFIGFTDKSTPISKHHLKMLSLHVSRRNTEDEVLWAIEDIIGPKELWPERVRDQLFWETKMTDELCLKYILFSVGNLLPSHLKVINKSVTPKEVI